jgi:hypothetical protein
MYFKNGVPIGYVELLTRDGVMEVGFNLYYAFRESETAWLYARLLKIFHERLAPRVSGSIRIRSGMRIRRRSIRARTGSIASSGSRRCHRSCVIVGERGSEARGAGISIGAGCLEEACGRRDAIHSLIS